jgi:nucleoside-diphosphate-sugar epimerase
MVLITGATGLVGSHLIFELVRSGHLVRALKRPGSSLEMPKKVFGLYSANPEEEFSKIKWVDGDILDIFSLEDAMVGVEEVYHCAALVSFLPEDKKKLIRMNTEGTANVVNAAIAGKVRKLCHVSSIAALGRPENQSDIIDESLVWKTSRHNSIYAISKYGAEREVWRGTAEGLDAVVVNPSIILGVAGPGMGSSRLFNTVYNGLKYYPPGKNGFVDVRDVVRAMVQLMKSSIVNERFILNAENVDYRRLFTMMAEAFDRPAPSIRVSPVLSGLAWRIEKLRSMATGVKPLITPETANTAVQQYQYSNEKLKKELGFEYIPIEDTIKYFARVFVKG